MVGFNTQEFYNSMKGGGARPNLFTVEFDVPAGVQLKDGNTVNKLKYHAKAAQLPSDTIGAVDLAFHGRNFSLPGNRVFEEWMATFYLDDDWAARDYIERWHEALNSSKDNVAEIGLHDDTINYFTDIKCHLQNKAGQTVRTYILRNAYPTAAFPVELDWGANDVLAELQVSWRYSHFEIERHT